MESNGIEAYIDPGLKAHLEEFQQINIDYITQGFSQGFTIWLGTGPLGCGTCGESENCAPQ
jgi:Fe-S cluster assembly iron-binding protein IscA